MYTTQADLLQVSSERLIIELSNDTDNLTTVNSTVVSAIIEQQSAIIDAYIGGRFTLPIANTRILAALKSYCNTLVLNALQKRRRELTEIEKAESASVFKSLEQIRDGKLFTDIQADGEEQTTQLSFQAWSETRLIYPIVNIYREGTI